MVPMRLVFGLAVALFLGSQSTALQAQPADLILHGGTVLTMDDKHPSAGAVAVRDGKITALGSLEALSSQKGPATRLVDLAGKTLLPGFIDSHGHLIDVGLQRSVANLLPPPDGQVHNIAALREQLLAWAATDAAKRIGGGRIILGFGYDDAQLAERRHPTRHDLDLVSGDKPVVIIHQ